MNIPRLYAIITLGLSLTSCVIPMPIEVDETEANFAPSYDPLWVTPRSSMLIEYDPVITQGESIEFDVGPLDDPNESDILFWRVFLNYQGRFYNAIYRSNQGGGISLTRRAEGVHFTLNPCLDFKLFSFEGPYRVELIVSDRPFQQDPDERVFINQLLAEEAMSFRIHWFIRFPQELCPL
jgi:hypothetical protein